MANYKCIGFEHKVGNKKSNGQPYDLYIYHCIDERPIVPAEESFGERVETIIINGLFSGPQPIPAIIPASIHVSYSRFGYPDMVTYHE